MLSRAKKLPGMFSVWETQANSAVINTDQGSYGGVP